MNLSAPRAGPAPEQNGHTEEVAELLAAVGAGATGLAQKSDWSMQAITAPEQSTGTELAELSAAVGRGAAQLLQKSEVPEQAITDKEGALPLTTGSASPDGALLPAPSGTGSVGDLALKQARLEGTRLVKQSYLTMNLASAEFQRAHYRMQCPARQGHWQLFLEYVGNPTCHAEPLECKACLHVRESLPQEAQALRGDTQGRGSTTDAEAATTALVKRQADAEPVQDLPCKRRRGRPPRQAPRIDLYTWLREERPGKYELLCTETRKEDIPMMCLVCLSDVTESS